MLQMSARPDRCGLGVERQSYAAPFEVLRGVNTAARIDENITMPEHPRREHRKGDERTIARAMQADEFGGGQFRNVELTAPDHTVEDLPPGFERDAGEVDALDVYVAVADRLQAVIATAREGEREAGHGVVEGFGE